MPDVRARHAGAPPQDILALIDDLDAIVWELDPRSSRFDFVSARAEDVLGYPAAQWIEEEDFWARHLHPDDRDAAVAARREAAARGVDHVSEYRMIAADGSIVWIRDHARVTVDAARRAARLRGVMVDVTNERCAQESLRIGEARLDETERRYRRLVDALPDGVAVHADGRVVFINPAGARLLGASSPDELIGRTIFDFIHPESLPKSMQRMRTLVEERQPVPFETIRVRRLDGVDVWLELAGVPYVYEGRPAIQTISRDVTARVRAEAALKDVEDQLRQSQKLEAIGRLAGGIAHDFNNLLTVIGVYVELVLNAMAPSDPRRRDAEEAKRATLRAAELTHQLLAFSRRQVLKPTVLDLNEVVRDAVKMLRRILVEDIRVEAPLARVPLLVRTDRGQLEQVILNLALNARDAMPDGGTLTLHTDILDVSEEFGRRYMGVDVVPGRYVRLGVSDTGVGMDEATRLRVFEPFFTTKPGGQGTGLGLASVYGIVKQSGGYIWVESQPGAGATFTMYFPEVDRHAPDAAAGSMEPRGGSETILIAEDDDSVRGIASRILRSVGYHVLEARNGREALDVAREYRGRIDLLISDVVMPGMGGRELADAARASRPTLRVLFTSGYTDDEILRRGLSDAGLPFLDKPFTIPLLLGKVREVLEATSA